MSTPLPVSALLSQVLVAFTIEFDNEFEHRMPHRTTRNGGAGRRQGPWLVSQAMWENFMRFVVEPGVPLGDLDGPVAVTNLAGLTRWGYIEVGPDPADRHTKAPRRNWLVRPTDYGRRAQKVWRPLASLVEERWRTRFGDDVIGQLRAILEGLAPACDPRLPRYLPVAYQGMSTVLPTAHRSPSPWGNGHPGSPDELSTLLSRALMTWAVDFERRSPLSLPMGADCLRVIDPGGVPVHELPGRAGVSKEATAMMTGYLAKRGYLAIDSDPTRPRGRRVGLTRSGQKARQAYQRRLAQVDIEWSDRFGDDRIAGLREVLSGLVGPPGAVPPPLWEGLVTYADGWRASARPPDALPHYPMVLHRGGFPDGS